MGSVKYDALRAHLAAYDRDRVQLTFAEVDAIVGGLPESARVYAQWWENDQHHVQSRAWRAAGYRASANLTTEHVMFVRADERDDPFP